MKSFHSTVYVCMLSCFSCVQLFAPYGLQPSRLLHLWDSPGKHTGVGCHALLQRIFLTQGSNPGLPHCRQILSHQGSLYIIIHLSKPTGCATLKVNFNLHYELRVICQHGFTDYNKRTTPVGDVGSGGRCTFEQGGAILGLSVLCCESRASLKKVYF